MDMGRFKKSSPKKGDSKKIQPHQRWTFLTQLMRKGDGAKKGNSLDGFRVGVPQVKAKKPDPKKG